MINCAARELFEEVGVMLARGSQTLTVGQRTSLLDDLESGRMTWPELLAALWIASRCKRFHFRGPVGDAAICAEAI